MCQLYGVHDENEIIYSDRHYLYASDELYNSAKTTSKSKGAIFARMK
jgi:hypothetical protein